MKIDVHGHVTAPDALYAWKANILAHRGAHGVRPPSVTDDAIREAWLAPHPSFGNVSHFDHIDGAGIDVQLISPRPYQMMHSERPALLVDAFTEAVNDMIYRSGQLFPGRFKGIAGLPQSPDTDVAAWTTELRRTVTELGFVGALLNPDPHEGLAQPPALGERYWYPLWEVLCELDVPAIIHSAGCRPPSREPYSLHFIQEETIAVWSLLSAKTFEDFPDLKIVVSHGGGAIPYQVGRFLPTAGRYGGGSYIDKLRKLYFDTCLYTQDAIELLVRTVGVDRCLFGTEKPGTGSQINPETGGWYDDIHTLIEQVTWLDDGDRTALFEGNARTLFRL